MPPLRPREIEFEAPPAPAPVRAGRTTLLRLVWYGVLALAVMAAFHTLHFARAVFVPIALAVLLNLLLGGPVKRLARLGAPEPLGAALVLVCFVGAIAFGFFQLSAPARGWIEGAPQNIARLEEKLRPVRETVEEVRRTTEQVEQMADPVERGAPAVAVKGPGLVSAFLTGAGRTAAMLGATIVLLYFLLASGDLFLRKLVKALPTFHDKKRAVEIANQAQDDISRYLVTITLMNAALGSATALAMWALGMPNPVLWGVLAGLNNFVPYLGSLTTAAVLTLVAGVTFDELSAIVAPPLAFLALTTLEGQFLTPMLLGKRLTLNPVVIFLALLIWGWLWGVPGVLMAVPLLAAFKILCDHVGALQPVGELLGRRE